MRRLRLACEQEGLDFRAFEGVTIVPPGELTPQSGDHYRVFTPFWRAWRAASKRDPLPAPRKLRSPSRPPSGRLPKLSDLTRGLAGQRPAPRWGIRRPGPPRPLASKRARGGMWIWPTTSRRTPRRI